MLHPEHRELLAGIIAHAADDVPRLVYSDWLEEHGDRQRAEFIRVQCALAAQSPVAPDYVDLLERNKAVLPALARRQLGPQLPKAVGFYDNREEGDDTSDSYQRGFPFFATEPYVEGGLDEILGAQAFRAALPELIASTTLRGLRFGGAFSRQLAVILSSPAAGELTALAVNNLPAGVASESAAVAALTGSAAGASLRWLELDYLDATPDLETLARTPALGQLRRFNVRWLGGEPAALQRLLAASWFGQLRRVEVGLMIDHMAENARALVAGLADLPDLHTLTLYDLPAEGTAAFASRRFRSLGKLFLRHAALRGEGAARLSQARLPLLADLRLERCKLHNDEVASLCQSELFSHLRVLSLEGNWLGDKGVALLAAHPGAARWRILNLENNHFGKRGLQALARPGVFPELTSLNLCAHTKPKATAEDLTRFLTTAQFPRLRHLDLSQLPVDDHGAQALAGNPTFANLVSLNLGFAQLGPVGGAALFASSNLRNLVKLTLSSNPMAGKVEPLLDPAVLPSLCECWLPDDVPPELKAKLKAARDTLFIG